MNRSSPALRVIPVILVILLTVVLAACSSATPARPDPTRGPLPTLAAQPWLILGGTLSRDTADKIRPVGRLLAHQATVNRLAFSPDGRWLLSVDATNAALLWDLETGRQVRQISQAAQSATGDGDTLFAFFNADAAQVVAVTSAKTLRFTDRASGAILAELVASDDPIQWADSSADGRVLAVGDAKGAVTIWDLGARQPVQRLGPATGPIRMVRLAPKGQTVAALTTDDRGLMLRVWDLPTSAPDKPRAEVREFGRPPRLLLFSPDGSLLAAGGRLEIQVLNTASMTRRYRLTGEELMGDRGIAFSPDGKLFAALGTGQFVYVWQADDGLLIAALPRHEGAASGLAFSPDSSLLLTTITRPGAYLWRVDSFGADRTEFPRGTIALEGSGYLTGAWSPDSKRLILAEASGALLAYGIPAAP